MGMSLRVYPGTYLVSIVAGFIEDGSGVGSVKYAKLWDDNVGGVKPVGPNLDETLIQGEALEGLTHSPQLKLRRFSLLQLFPHRFS
jgi:FAD/FMN-containing dehydrogenase